MENFKIIDGTYEVIEELGHGAQGVIFKVRNLHNDQILSLKMINFPKNKQLDDEAFAESIKAEFKIIKNLEHPNIIKVFDFGFDPAYQKYYFTMEYLDGCNIGKFMRGNGECELFTELSYQCLLGLNYLHANNIIHFDIKPDNIFVIKNPDRSCQIKILDFGLSELKTENLNLKAKGTLIFMAPEIFIDHNRVGHQIDLYSLGISLLHSLYAKGDLYSLSSIISSQEIIKGLSNAHKENEDLLARITNRKIARFLGQLIEPNPDIRLSSATDAITALNRIFATDYQHPQISQTTSLVNNTKFLIRDNVIGHLMNAKDQVQQDCGCTVFLESETGAGKSKIVNRFNYIISLMLQKTIKIEPDNNNPGFKDLAHALADRFNAMFHGLSGIQREYEFLKSLQLDSENFQLLYSDGLLRMISLALTKAPVTLIIEDLESFQQNALQFLHTLVALTGKQPLMLILTISTDLSGSEALEAYRMLSSDNRCQILKLEPLKPEDIPALEEELLGTISNRPQNLTDNVLAFSQGNFRKAMQIYDYLIDREVIKKINEIYYFNNKLNYQDLLSADFNHYLQITLDNLSENDIRALALLTASYFKTDITEMARILNTNLYELRKRMQKLAGKRLVKIHNSHDRELYFLENEEVKEYVNSKITDQELMRFYHELAGIQLSKSTTASHLNTLCKLLFGEKYGDDTDLTDLFDDLSLHESGNGFFYALKNFIRLTKDREFRFRLELELFSHYYTRNRDKCKDLLKKLKRSYKTIRTRANRIAFIQLTIDYAWAENLFKFDVDSFLKNDFDFLKENQSTEKLFANADYVIYSLHNRPGQEEAVLAVFNKIKQHLLSNPQIPAIYLIALKEMEIRYNFCSGNIEQIIQIAEDIRKLSPEDQASDRYFDIIGSLVEAMEQAIPNGSGGWLQFEDLFKSAVHNAALTKKRNHIQTTMRMLALYYFKAAQFSKSYICYNKIFEFNSKHNLQTTITVYADFSSLKYLLYYPVDEVIKIYEAMKSQLVQLNDMQNYMIICINEMFVNYKSGNFKLAKAAIIENFAKFKFISEQFAEDQFTRLAQFLPDLYLRDEIEQIVKESLKNGNISQLLAKKFMDRIRLCYAEILWTRYHHKDYQNKLNGQLDLATPVLVMEYIKRVKKLPPANIVMQDIPLEFNDKSVHGNYLTYLVTQFMLTKNDKMLKPILETAKKLYIHGYLLPVIYTIMPILEFCLYLKVPSTKFEAIGKLYREVEEQLFSNLSDEEAGVFKHNKIYKTGVKVLEQLSKKGR